MKAVRVQVALAAIAATVALIGSAPSPQTADSIVFGTVGGFKQDFGPYYIAQALGYFKKENLDVAVVPTATYLCCDGPRFESPAEVRLFGRWGADVVGMTGLPEAIFAKEAGIEYAGLGIVTNLGAGLTPDPIEHTAVVSAMSESINTVRELLLAATSIVYEEFTRLDS